MLKIRLQRIGRRNQPAFRVVVTESTRGPRAGTNVEVVGTFNPHSDKPELKIDRIKEWMAKGAQVSPRVHNMLVDQNVIEGKKVNVLPKKSPIVKEKVEEESAPAPEGETVAKAETSAEPVAESAPPAGQAEPAPEASTEPAPTEEPKEEASQEEKKEEATA